MHRSVSLKSKTVLKFLSLLSICVCVNWQAVPVFYVLRSGWDVVPDVHKLVPVTTILCSGSGRGLQTHISPIYTFSHAQSPAARLMEKNNLGSSGCHQPNCNLSTYNLLVASYCYMTWIILGSPFCSSIDCSCPESPQTPQVVITIILWNMIRGNPSLIMPGLLCILINVGIKLITKKNTHYNTLTGYKYRK